MIYSNIIRHDNNADMNATNSNTITAGNIFIVVIIVYSSMLIQ